MRKLLLGILISLPVLFAQPIQRRGKMVNSPPPAMAPVQHRGQMVNSPPPAMAPDVIKKPHFEEFLDNLGIKPAKRQKMLNMWFEHRKSAIDLRANIEKMEIDMKRLLMAKKLDEGKILEMAKKIGEAKVNQKIQDLKFKLKLLKLVPDKHKDEFKEFLFLGKKRFLRRRWEMMQKK